MKTIIKEIIINEVDKAFRLELYDELFPDIYNHDTITDFKGDAHKKGDRVISCRRKQIIGKEEIRDESVFELGNQINVTIRLTECRDDHNLRDILRPETIKIAADIRSKYQKNWKRFAATLVDMDIVFNSSNFQPYIVFSVIYGVEETEFRVAMEVAKAEIVVLDAD